VLELEWQVPQAAAQLEKAQKIQNLWGLQQLTQEWPQRILWLTVQECGAA
jgi:hypothetical protein